MDMDWLKFVVEDDDLNLLEVKAKTRAPTADDHLISNFSAINDFMSSYGRQPLDDKKNVPEFMLFTRLNSIIANAEHCEALREFDEYKLLPNMTENKVAEPKPIYAPQKEINSLDDIFADDNLGLLDDPSSDIFHLEHVSKERAEAESISRRSKCKNFDDYEELLKTAQQEIREGKRVLKMFDDKGESLVADGFYILHGILLYLESIDISSNEKTVNGKRFRKDGRTHCVFENGTESNMLYRSLAKELYKDGKIVSDTNDSLNSNFYKNFQGLKDEDQSTGFIYILKSLSTNPDVSSINNLYKIGYSTTSVEKRIANAATEPTYLMAGVEHISTYQCFNMNAQKFENLLHTFFGSACLDIEIADVNGKACHPREWFIAPLSAIESAIQLVINGEIVNYRFDEILEEIKSK